MRVLLVLLLSFSLSGCFLVKDFGAYWSNGVIDEDLAGKWVSTKDKNKIIEMTKTEDYYMQKGSENNMKTLVLGEHKFMMIVDNDNANRGRKMNMLVKYKVSADEYIIYSFKQKLYSKIQAELGKESSEVKSGKISALSINTLDEDMVKKLSNIAKDRKYWAEFAVFKKVGL